MLPSVPVCTILLATPVVVNLLYASIILSIEMADGAPVPASVLAITVF